ncbi:winged helix-turn-helix domain-containing protein [Paenibacillus sp. P26]|nr:winged helix-turn-helix domain-containing protein [Paenibacillus sp. P26]UUZ94796.1 winged helix-turn-helix domain-containing protein [Paenibacillus sp. P25]
MADSLTDPKELRKAILRELRSQLLASGNATKVELSRRTGISFPTVSKFLAQMETEGKSHRPGLTNQAAAGERRDMLIIRSIGSGWPYFWRKRKRIILFLTAWEK